MVFVFCTLKELPKIAIYYSIFVTLPKEMSKNLNYLPNGVSREKKIVLFRHAQPALWPPRASPSSFFCSPDFLHSVGVSAESEAPYSYVSAGFTSLCHETDLPPCKKWDINRFH